jgi:hypothetical protein
MVFLLLLMALLIVPGRYGMPSTADHRLPWVQRCTADRQRPWLRHDDDGPFNQVQHGWPLTYIWRRVPDPPLRLYRGFQFNYSKMRCWSLTEGVRAFRFERLAADVVLAVLLTATGGLLFEGWRRRRARLLQFHIIDLLVLTTAVSVLLAWLSATHKEYREEQDALDQSPGLALQLPGGPHWLRQLVGERFPKIFDRVVELYMLDESIPPPPLRHLRVLDVRGVRRDLSFLDDLPQLQVLELSRVENVDESQFAHVAGLHNLVDLRLFGSSWSFPPSRHTADAALSHLEGLRDLQHLTVDWDSLSGKGLAHLRNVSNLRCLDLWGAWIVDADLVHLASLNRLQRLALCWPRTSDATLDLLAGLVKLGHFKGLQSLVLDGTQISDAGLAHLAAMPNLHFVSLTNTKVSADALVRLRTALPSSKIDH